MSKLIKIEMKKCTYWVNPAYIGMVYLSVSQAGKAVVKIWVCGDDKPLPVMHETEQEARDLLTRLGV